MNGPKSPQLQSPSPIPPPWRPRFSLQGLFLVTLVCCAMGMAGAYFVRSLQGDRNDRFLFILFTLAGPAVMVVLVSLMVWVMSRLRR